MRKENARKFAAAICPFCNRRFSRPRGGDFSKTRTSSCGCDAMFCMADASDIGETCGVLKEEGVRGNIEVIRNFDYDPESHEEIVVVFWKPKKRGKKKK